MSPESKEVLEAVIRAAEHAKIIKGDGGLVKSKKGNVLSKQDSYIDAYEFIEALKDELNKCVLCGEQTHICQHEKGFDEEIKSMFKR